MSNILGKELSTEIGKAIYWNFALSQVNFLIDSDTYNVENVLYRLDTRLSGYLRQPLFSEICNNIGGVIRRGRGLLI